MTTLETLRQQQALARVCYDNALNELSAHLRAVGDNVGLDRLLSAQKAAMELGALQTIENNLIAYGKTASVKDDAGLLRPDDGL